MWAETYDRQLDDVFAVQSDIAGKVAEALRVKLTPQEKALIGKEQTASPEAHTLYLKGRFYWNERTKEANGKALEYFRKAVELDPDFALAYTGMADCYNIFQDYGWMKAAEALPLAKEYALKALKLDETLAEAHASLSLALSEDWDYHGAEAELKRAIELSPNYAIAYHWYALLLSKSGRNAEAHEMELRGLQIDPYSRTMGLGAAFTLYFLGRFEESMKRLDQLVELYPDYVGISQWRSVVASVMGKHDVAISEAERGRKIEHSIPVNLTYAQTLALGGRKEEARNVIWQVRRRATKEPIQMGLLGTVELLAEMEEDGFRHLDEAVGNRDKYVVWSRFDPIFRRFMSDPRWIPIEEKMNRALAEAGRTVARSP